MGVIGKMSRRWVAMAFCALALFGCDSGAPPLESSHTLTAALEEPSCPALDLVARKTYGPSVFTDAEVKLDKRFRYTLPTEVPVLSGNSGNHWITFSYGVGCTVQC